MGAFTLSKRESQEKSLKKEKGEGVPAKAKPRFFLMAHDAENRVTHITAIIGTRKAYFAYPSSGLTQANAGIFALV